MSNLYVSVQDKMASGWGQAEGKKSILVFVCDSPREAGIVRNNAVDRADFTAVSEVLTVEPQFNESTYFVQKKTKQDWPEFYQR
jgi:hypothetical protein